jgi:tetratricopeptide (TPR) repeat protein
MKVLMPPVDAAAFKKALRNDFDSLTYKTCRVDVEKATAREANDLVNIQRAIVEGGGFLKTNQLVIGAMKGWMVEEARSALEEMPVEERGTSNLLWNLASLLNDQGRLVEAEPLRREQLEAHRRKHGDEHPSTLGSINNLAILLKDQGKLGDAEPLYREALAGKRRTLGDEHPSTLMSINNLAILLSDQGKLGDAEPVYREALAGRRRTLWE